MAIRITRGPTDPVLDAVLDQLRAYEQQRPDEVTVEAYRHTPYSVRVRVIDAAFRTLSRSARSALIWPLLRSLPEDVLQDVSFVVLVAPDELASSRSSQEYEDPVPLTV